MKPIPSLTDIYNQFAADLKTKAGLTDTQLKMVADSMSSVLSAQLKLCYLYLSDIQNNIFADTADIASEGGTLNRQGQIYLNRQPRPATDGIYTANVIGLSGAVIRAGLTFKSNDSSNSPGNLYIIDDEYILPGTSGTITIRSLNAGRSYLLNAGDGLTATEPVIGLNQLIVITSVTQQPTEEESTDIYRENILNAIRLETQGGAKTDYRIWSSDAGGVRRVYPQVKNGDAGTVQVFVEATEVDSTDGNGTPSSAILDDVREVIEFDPDETLPTNERGRRPMQAAMDVGPITTKPVDVVIFGLQTDTTTIRSSISSNLKSFLYNVRPFIAGADLLRDKNDVLTSVKAQSIVSDTVGNANSFNDFQLYVDGVLTNSFTFSGGDIPYLRNVSYP